MSRYNVLYLSRKAIWFHAINQGLIQLARTNPGWTYSLHTIEQETEVSPNLNIIDLTLESDNYTGTFSLDSARVLVLVHAGQRRLIRHLLQQSRCSILCVDEHHFNFREIVESSMRNKRFLSPFISSFAMNKAKALDPVTLTDAEMKVLNFIRDGKNGVEISQALFRSQKTISSHKRNIMRKFGVRDDLSLKQRILALEEVA